MVRTPSGTRDDARRQLTERIAEAARLAHPESIRAIWANASANTDDMAPIDLTIVTYRTGMPPRPAALRVSGRIVTVSVHSSDECLNLATTIAGDWPLVAQRYLGGRQLFDPEQWHARLRDLHLSRLAEATDAEFAEAARQPWCRAASARIRAIRMAEWHDTDGAMLALGEARLAMAMVDGLMTRTYFADSAEAVTRSGLGSAGLTEIGDRLAARALEMADRGRPIDGTVADLWSQATPVPMKYPMA